MTVRWSRTPVLWVGEAVRTETNEKPRHPVVGPGTGALPREGAAVSRRWTRTRSRPRS